MVLGEVIGEISFTALPVDSELSLADPVSDPIKSHINGFGSLDFGGVIGETHSRGVVADNWGNGPGPTGGLARTSPGLFLA